jgi:hypothetical protein
MVKKSCSTIIVTIFLSIALLGAAISSPTQRAYSQHPVPGGGVEVPGTDHNTGVCGPMDIAIVLDDTGSMGSSLINIKKELPIMINQALIASGGDLRVGYITFKDAVTVHYPLTTNINAVENGPNSIATTIAKLGNNLWEASDEAKNTAVNNLAPRSGQSGDFSIPKWRPAAVKIVVLITDAPPGGFTDPSADDPVADQHMHALALDAMKNNILVSDVFVPTGSPDPDYGSQLEILKDDAVTSNGAFTMTQADGNGTGNAIKTIISNCGKGTPTVQHWDKIVFSIISPALAKRLNLTANTELDIKVLDDPTKVADIKQKVLSFLHMPTSPFFRNSIKIIDVEYAIISTPSVPKSNMISETPALAKHGSSSVLAKIKELQTSSTNATNLAPAQNTTSR